jgi:hypothetical protein
MLMVDDREDLPGLDSLEYAEPRFSDSLRAG